MSANPSVIYRLPDPAEIDRSVRGTDSEKKTAMRKLKKSVERAWNAFDAGTKRKIEGDFTAWGQKTSVADFLGERTPADGWVYDEKALLVRLVGAMRDHGTPGLTLHPGYGSVRPLKPNEDANLKNIIASLKVLVQRIQSPEQDKRLADVFGATKVTAARQIFAEGLASLESLARGGNIQVDTIKRAKVWHAVGLAGATSMTLGEGVLDRDDNEAVIVVAHEMTHTIPNGRATGDKVYKDHPNFTTAGEQIKVVTAAYYEEVVRQILNNESKPPFVPVDNTTPMVITVPLLDQYKARATQVVTLAWATAINLYSRLREAGAWAEPMDKAGKEFRWPPEKLALFGNISRLMGLSIHRRPTLLQDNRNPVTPLDLALLDNRLSMLGKLMTAIEKVVAVPAGATAFVEARVDDVLRDALILINNNRATPGVLSNKSVDKDVDVLRALEGLNDAPDWANLTPNLQAGLPARVRHYGA